jgi:hypothetical protein
LNFPFFASHLPADRLPYATYEVERDEIEQRFHIAVMTMQPAHGEREPFPKKLLHQTCLSPQFYVLSLLPTVAGHFCFAIPL